MLIATSVLDLPVWTIGLTCGYRWTVKSIFRANYYQHFFLKALECRNIVRIHWFKYRDDPAESQALDSAGGANKGMFDVDGRPYKLLLDAAGEVNREVYPLIEFLDDRNASTPAATSASRNR